MMLSGVSSHIQMLDSHAQKYAHQTDDKDPAGCVRFFAFVSMQEKENLREIARSIKERPIQGKTSLMHWYCRVRAAGQI